MEPQLRDGGHQRERVGARGRTRRAPPAPPRPARRRCSSRRYASYVAARARIAAGLARARSRRARRGPTRAPAAAARTPAGLTAPCGPGPEGVHERQAGEPRPLLAQVEPRRRSLSRSSAGSPIRSAASACVEHRARGAGPSARTPGRGRAARGAAPAPGATLVRLEVSSATRRTRSSGPRWNRHTERTGPRLRDRDARHDRVARRRRTRSTARAPRSTSPACSRSATREGTSRSTRKPRLALEPVDRRLGVQVARPRPSRSRPCADSALRARARLGDRPVALTTPSPR